MAPSTDSDFGPTVADRFDFTLLFELIMLGMVPAGIVILITPFYMRNLVSATNQVRPGLLLWAKFATGIALVAVQLASILLWHNAGLYRSDVTLAASIMSFIASLCVVALLYITHTFSLRQSGFLSLFLTATMLFDITMTRSYFLRSSLDALGALQATTAALKFALIGIEEIPKAHLFRSNLFRLGPGELVGFWNRALLLWINPILRLGFRKDFTVDELPHIGDGYGSERLFDRFVPNWTKVDKTKTWPLVRALLRTLHWRFLAPILPRLCFVGLSFSRPFYMARLIDFVSGGVRSSDGAIEDTSYGLIGAAILIFGGILISRSVFQRLEFEAITCVRGILIVAIYDKMQDLSIDELEKSSAITLMTTDVSGVQDGLGYIHSTWSSLVELGLGMYALYTFVGYACFLLFIPTSIAATGTYIVTKKMANARTVWNAKVETRVAATSNVLAQLKSVKAMGLTNAMSLHLQEKRLDEIQTSMIERNSRIMNYGIYGFGAAMTPVAVLAGARFWTRASNPMTVSETFATYAAIFIAALPLNSLLAHLPFYASGYACLLRIQKFLMVPQLRDQRECPDDEQFDPEKPATNVQPGPYAVKMDNVSVTSDFSGPILKDVSLRIPTGSLAMVKGTVGSGKSAFLKTALGELAIDTGTIEVGSKNIAYVSQTPWIRNTSIRANVIGPFPFVQERYDEVVFACALDKDFEDLPNGDQTLTGSNGCNLSGGQKQRLHLACALFAEASTILLDNCLSSLDSDTADLVFKRVCGRSGLLRQRGATIIMTTNNPELLAEADVVFEISHQGRVRQRKGGNRTNSAADRTAELREETPGPEIPANVDPEKPEPPSVDANNHVSNSNEFDRDRRHGDWRLYGYFFRSASKWLFLLWLLVTAVAAVMERMPQIFMRIWLSADAANDNYFIGFAILSFIEIIITCASGAQFLKQIIPISSANLHWQLLETVMDATFPFISHTDAGSLLNRFSLDISLISQRLPLMLMTTVSMFFNVLVDMGIIASGAKYTAPIILFLLLLLYGIQHFYLRTSRQLRYLELETTSPLVTHFTEMNAGMAHIRGPRSQLYYKKELLARLDHSQRPFYYLLCIQQWLTLMLDFMTFVSALTLIAVTTLVPGSSSDSAIGLSMLNLISFSTTASYFLQTWVHLETSLGGLARIQAFCQDTPVEKDRTDTEPLPENWPSTGKIDFNCVTAQYIGPQGEARSALKNTTVSIQHGQKVGISGRTGSGKSSMMFSLLNLMEFSGSINIDGRGIRTIPRQILRSHITTMTQEGVELKGTIRANVFPFSTTPPTDEEIIDSLQRVGIWEQVNRHGGLEANVVKAGLSHGQKQLLFLARAMLHQQTMETKIILVDEATSSLDPDTDAKMQEVMTEAFAACTVITIAHQRDYSDKIDLAIELDSGVLVKVQRRSTRTGEWVDSL